MLFRCASIITLLICAQGALSAGSNFSLYAYGDKLPTGMKLFHADGTNISPESDTPTHVAQVKLISDESRQIS